jgi:Tol biopolymer transport system component
LVFSHVTMYGSGGDVIATRCEESGLFALDIRQRTIRQLYRYDQPPVAQDKRCVAPMWLYGLSLGRSGELLYGYANRENRVHALDLATGRESGIGPTCDYRVVSPRLSPDGSSIAVIWGCGHPGGSTLLATMHVDGSHHHALAQQDKSGAEDPSWSPDGQWLVFTRNNGSAGEGDPHVAIVDTSGHRLRVLVAGSGPEWSPTGEWIAYESDTRPNSTIRLIRPNGKDDHVVVDVRPSPPQQGTYGPEWDGASEPIRWSPDGHTFAFTRRRVLWECDITTGVITQLTSVDGRPEK